MSVRLLAPIVHVYGDAIRDVVFGRRGEKRFAAASVYERYGIKVALHSDGLVLEAKPLYFVWSTAMRTTSQGNVHGPQYREEPYDAFLGVTLNGAKHLGLEDDLGSLRVGKLAELVILGADPLEVVPNEVRKVPIVETLQGGVSVYQNRRTEPRTIRSPSTDCRHQG